MSVVSPTGNATSVTYDLATATDGAPPLTITCTPVSGTSFIVGSTTVTCTATDTRQRAVSCTFPIVVTPPPRISVTRFMAFGDSITRGEVVSEGITPFGHKLLIDDAKAYPTQLSEMLNARYTTQRVTVDNRGEPGVRAVNAGPDLSAFLRLTQYDVVLLMHGNNDLLAAQDAVTIQNVANAVQQMVRDAKSRGVRVFLATLPPQDPNGCCPRRGVGAPAVVPYNDKLKLIAATENVPLVDVYQAFNGDTRTLIDFDGLHPTGDGYKRIAGAFYETIKARLEVVTPTTTMTVSSFPVPFFNPPRRR